jgi:hypothetical protein
MALADSSTFDRVVYVPDLPSVYPRPQAVHDLIKAVAVVTVNLQSMLHIQLDL